MASEGRILFMTTNCRDVLDSALTRPGRVDVDVVIGNANKKQAADLFLRFFPNHPFLADAFGAKAAENNISMAQLQGVLLKHKDDAETALAADVSSF